MRAQHSLVFDVRGGCSRCAFPERCALGTIPDGKSIACSAPQAVAWYPEWEASSGDISGRAVDVHDATDGFEFEEDVEAGSSGGAVPSFTNTKEASGSTSPVAIAYNTARGRALRSAAGCRAARPEAILIRNFFFSWGRTHGVCV